MEVFIKNLGGMKALKLRVIFVLFAVFFTSLPLVQAEPEHIQVEEEPTTVVVEETTEPVKIEAEEVHIKLESVEKDIRIGFYKDDGSIYTGYKFKVEVTDADGKSEKYEDDDRDGFIIIKDVTPGIAKIKPISNKRVTFEEEEYELKVKDHVEYKPIQNIVVENNGEDTNKAPESVALLNTVELIESKVEEIITYIPLSKAGLTVNNPYPQADPTENPTEDPQGAGELSEGQPANFESEGETLPETTKLLDSTGKHQLYLNEGDKKFREATYADYSETAVFYIMQKEYKYYGWQNIDGKMYYFDKDGKYVVGPQVIDGVQYSFSQTGVRGGTLGVDVSVYQGSIDWQKAKAAGIDFAIIRLGFRGWGSNGSLNIDSNFRANLAGAKAAGIKVGVYFFSQAKTEVEAVEEASLCIRELGGQGLDLPIFIDTENSGAPGGTGRADGLTTAQRTAVCVAFCNTIRNSGYRAGVYSNKYFFNNKLNTSQLLSYTIWLAEWPSEMNANSKPTYSGRYDIWQFSERGNGQQYGMQSTYVDLNYS